MGSADALLENRVTSLKPSKAPGSHLDFRTKAGAQCLGDTGKSRQELIKQIYGGVWATWLAPGWTRLHSTR